MAEAQKIVQQKIRKNPTSHSPNQTFPPHLNMAYNFVDSIQSQTIFKKILNSPNGPFGRKLLINENRDAFVASENILKACTINSQSQGYRIVSSLSPFLDIVDMEIDGSGKHIYKTDLHRVVVQVLPTKIGGSKDVLTSVVSGFELEGLTSKVRKIVWNDFVDGNLLLVVLQDDNTLHYYDLTVDSAPLQLVKLDLQGDEATTISFGSRAELGGALTLYIGTKNSKIYAIFPFVSHKSTILVTEDELSAAYTTAQQIDFTDCEPHLQWYKSLYHSTKSSDPSGYRKIGKQEVMCYRLKVGQHKNTIQGPLASLEMGEIADLSCVGDDDTFPQLVAINRDSLDVTVKYLTQFVPLLKDHEPRQLVPITHSSYKLPSQGFGYIDSDDSEDEQDEDFFKLTVTGVDILTNVTLSDERMILTYPDPSKFLIYSQDKTVVITVSDRDIKKYEYLVFGDDSCFTPALIRDDILFTGGYLVCYYSKDSGKEPSVKRISESDRPDVITTKMSQLLLTNGDAEQVVIDSKIQSELLAEIDSDLNHSKIDHLKYHLDSKQSTTESLKTLNKFSGDVLPYISKFEAVILKLTLQIKANLMELQYQVETFNDTADIQVKEDYSGRIETLLQKQKDTTSRYKKLHQKLVRYLEDLKIKRQIPPSESEKKWFAEINQVTKFLGDENSGLTKTVAELREQVNQVKSLDLNKKSSSSISGAEPDKMLLYVKNQGTQITDLKTKVETLVKSCSTEVV